jgi:imidazolonepropionase-like amidohydrolase
MRRAERAGRVATAPRRSGASRTVPLARALLALAVLAAVAAAVPAVDSAAQGGGGTWAIVGGTVHTLGPAGTLDNATVVISGGRIQAVGRDLPIPAGAQEIDARGKVVTPGLFDSMSAIGAVEISLEESTRDFATEQPRLGAAFRVADAINPRSTLIPVNRIEGLTRALVAPRASTGPIAGRAATIHLGGGDPVTDPAAALVVALGEEGAERAGGSRAAALALLAEALEDARDYARHRAAWERAERRPYAPGRLDLEALQPVIAGEVPVAAHVERASDLLAALRLAREQRVRLVVVGGAEAHLVARELAAAGVPVVLDPLANLPESFESLAATLENAARLHAAGVPVAFTSGESHNGRNLRQGAGNAVAHGLPWEAGLAAMTRVPARLWGVDAYGTLEPGKDADVVVWDGDPLEVTTAAERVFIRGEAVPMVSRQTLLRDRYRDLDGPLPPAYDKP